MLTVIKTQSMQKDPKPLPWSKNPNYLIYPDGRVFSVINDHFIRPAVVKGSHVHHLEKTSGATKFMTVHRAVAEMFCPNPENKPIVTHIDGDSLNNHYTNLKWVTQSENYDYNQVKAGCIKIYQKFPDEVFLIEHNSIQDAVEYTGILRDVISRCLRGERKTAKDKNGQVCTFEYVNKPQENEEIPENSVEVNGYPEYYVTNDGRIFSTKRGKKKWMKLRERNGYVSVKLSSDNKRKNFFVHRLVAEHFIEDKPENYQEMQVNHIDGVRNNNHISNLEYVTASQNTKHSYEKLGRKASENVSAHSKKSVKIYHESNPKKILKFPSVISAARYIGSSDKGIAKKIRDGRKINGWVFNYDL
jgi:hypothetical protein